MQNVIGIRKEDKDVTERRAPLTPEQVKELIRDHRIRVIVEPSPNRIFTETDYRNAGAEISSDLSSCNIIFGVKEIPVNSLIPNKALCFFSHTIKAQPYNMPMLKKILELKDTLLDYELVMDANGKRIIFFGTFAGYAGMIDSLWAMGQRLKLEGYHTPLAEIQQAYRYSSLKAARAAIAEIGEKIKKDGLPDALTPFIVGFTGRGHVAQGAQDIFDLLPVETISPTRLIDFVNEGNYSNRVLYKTVFLRRHIYAPKEGSADNLPDEYFRNPQNLKPHFQEYLPYLSMLINCIYWEPPFPKLITRAAIRQHYLNQKEHKLKVIGDITCDIQGSIELTIKPTSYLNPVYVYEPLTDRVIDGLEGNGPVIMAVDKLPTELPREASEYFGNSLKPFVPDLAAANYDVPFTELTLPEEFRKAVIAHRGMLTPSFKYLQKHLPGE